MPPSFHARALALQTLHLSPNAFVISNAWDMGVEATGLPVSADLENGFGDAYLDKATATGALVTLMKGK